MSRCLHRYFATCARGLETVLADELRALKARDVTVGRGGVHFHGNLTTLYQANLWLRTAIRVLQPIHEADVASPDELYAMVKALDWSQYMTPAHTLAVDCNVRDSAITHSRYAALRVKDAICDQFVERQGKRPSVDVERPMVGLNLHIHQNHAVLSLDSSGDSLHKRGYRPIQTKAPLNEALAAGLVLLAGWRGDVPFIDPMCGSGTLCIEAAWLALDRPPGLTRKHFGFQGWMNYDVALWAQLRDEARRGVKKSLPQPILGSDVRRDVVRHAQLNARAAGIGNLLRFITGDVKDFRPPESPPGVILCNPPYGERLGEEKDLIPLYRALGELIDRCAGWKVFVFIGNAFLARKIGHQLVRAVELFNGKLRCRLLEFTGGSR
ncbi:MAG: THUMP domain-containing protein [Gemmataceae bacterium]|nr:THUMP domain-containing protein [Gemmataceae bacterium]